MPIWRGAGSSGCLLGAARVRRGGGDRGLRAVADPAQVAGEAGRHPEVEVAEELVAVVAVELQVEVAEGAGERVRRAGDEPRVERPHLARAGRAAGARVEAEELLERLGREGSFQGTKSRLDRVEGAVGRGRHQAPVGGEEVEVELFERDLRQVVEERRQLAGLRVGMEGADQLRVDAEAVERS